MVRNTGFSLVLFFSTLTPSLFWLLAACQWFSILQCFQYHELPCWVENILSYISWVWIVLFGGNAFSLSDLWRLNFFCLLVNLYILSMLFNHFDFSSIICNVFVEMYFWVWSDLTVTVTPKLHEVLKVFSKIRFLYRWGWTVLSNMYQKVRECLTGLLGGHKLYFKP